MPSPSARHKNGLFPQIQPVYCVNKVQFYPVYVADSHKLLDFP